MADTKIEKLGKYEVKEEIGRGSMGVVYRGFDPFLDREVALKVALSDMMQDKHFSQRYSRMFFNEARVAGMLDHPNIVHVYDAGMEGSYSYLVMEYIKSGKTLRDFSRASNLLPQEKVLAIIFKCCKALDYAHTLGVIHRDIKPGNIMLTMDMEVKLGDFSVAQIVKGDETQVAGFLGSPLYMSPEQVKEEELTNRTDLYSLGVVMFELLTGTPPFSGENVSSLIYKIITESPVNIRQIKPDIPETIENIIKKALSRNPDDRYQRGLDFAADISHAYRTLKHSGQGIKEQEKFEKLKKLDFFRDFYNSELWEVIKASDWVEFEEEQRIITEGEIDESFYILVTGEVYVKKGDNVLVKLKHGDCFGEMGYLSKSRRTADIISFTQVSLLKVNGTLIDKASVHCQLRFNRVFLRTLIERLARTSEKLAKDRPANSSDSQ
ncbi:MAG: protein kinase [Nitrospirae bacterium]|nr:protein kinase [Nitrospirota bacterium]